MRPFPFSFDLTAVIRSVRLFACPILAAFLLIGVPAHAAEQQNLSFKVPPVKIPLKIKDENITIVASALISQISVARDVYTFNLELRTDLADL